MKIFEFLFKIEIQMKRNKNDPNTKKRSKQMERTMYDLFINFSSLVVEDYIYLYVIYVLSLLFIGESESVFE